MLEVYRLTSRVRMCAVPAPRPAFSALLAADFQRRQPASLHPPNSLPLRRPLANGLDTYTRRSKLCSPAFAERGPRSAPILRGSRREQRLGIFRGTPAVGAFAAGTADTRHYAASNPFRMRTCANDHPARSVGESHLQDELSPVNRVIPSDEPERGNSLRISIYPNSAAKSCTFCTYAKRGGGVRAWGRLKARFSPPVGDSIAKAYASRASNSRRICTSEIIGLKPPLESTLAKMTIRPGLPAKVTYRMSFRRSKRSSRATNRSEGTLLETAGEVLTPVTVGGVLTPVKEQR